jgi:hypothetical protein
MIMASPGACSNSAGGVRGCEQFKKLAVQDHPSTQIQDSCIGENVSLRV